MANFLFSIRFVLAVFLTSAFTKRSLVLTLVRKGRFQQGSFGEPVRFYEKLSGKIVVGDFFTMSGTLPGKPVRVQFYADLVVFLRVDVFLREAGFATLAVLRPDCFLWLFSSFFMRAARLFLS